MPTKYEPLTKIILDSNGREVVVCRYYGTATCRNIHKNTGCANCPMIAAILNQLNAFEEVYMDEHQ